MISIARIRFTKDPDANSIHPNIGDAVVFSQMEHMNDPQEEWIGWMGPIENEEKRERIKYWMRGMNMTLRTFFGDDCNFMDLIIHVPEDEKLDLHKASVLQSLIQEHI